MEEPSIDSIIEKILAVPQNVMAHAGVTKEEVELICSTVIPILDSQPTLLDIPAPLSVVGDIHGQLPDLMRVFEKTGTPDKTRFLFLGDYVDRGQQGIECVSLLLCYKIKYPSTFFMLRGNHECSYINRLYGFFDECAQFLGVDSWKRFCDVFEHLPIAAIIEQKIFCVHGGISQDLDSLDQIREIKRPVEVPDSGFLCDLLWSDPDPTVDGWDENERGTSYIFGPRQVNEFLERFGLDLICRAHQAVMDGYDFPFAENQTIVTIFSAPNYCYVYQNKGAVLEVSDNLFCKFAILDPIEWDGIDDLPDRAATPPRVGYSSFEGDYFSTDE